MNSVEVTFNLSFLVSKFYHSFNRIFADKKGTNTNAINDGLNT